MPDKKISALDTATSVSTDDYVPVVDDPGGTPVTKKITMANFVTSIGALLTSIAALSITGALYLAAQPAGRILYTESGGAATTTSNLLYGTSTQVLSVRSIINSGSSTISGLSFTNATGTNATTTNFATTNFSVTNFNPTNLTWTNATGTNATTTKLYSTDIQAQSVSSTRFYGQRNSSGCGSPAYSVYTNSNTGMNIVESPYSAVWMCAAGSLTATFEGSGSTYNSHLYPYTNNIYNLGLSTFYWNTTFTTNVTSTNVTTTNMFVKGNSKLGTKSTPTTLYIGTTDGCGAWVFSASNTNPTLTPTSTSFCN